MHCTSMSRNSSHMLQLPNPERKLRPTSSEAHPRDWSSSPILNAGPRACGSSNRKSSSSTYFLKILMTSRWSRGLVASSFWQRSQGLWKLARSMTAGLATPSMPKIGRSKLLVILLCWPTISDIGIEFDIPNACHLKIVQDKYQLSLMLTPLSFPNLKGRRC